MQSIEEDEEDGEMKLQSIDSNNAKFRLDKKWGCKLFHKYLFKHIVVMQEWFGQVEKDLKTLNPKRYFEEESKIDFFSFELQEDMCQLFAIFCIDEWNYEPSYKPDFIGHFNSVQAWYKFTIPNFQISSCTKPMSEKIKQIQVLMKNSGLHADSPSFLGLKDFYSQLQLFHNLFEPVPLRAWEDMADDTNFKKALEGVDWNGEGMKFMSSSPYFLYFDTSI